MLKKNYDEVFAVNKRTQAEADLNNNDKKEQLTVSQKQVKKKDLTLRLVL